MEKQIKIALAGNPNCGKTTLFNAYTGANLKVANWPGVTVEKKEGHYRFQNCDCDMDSWETAYRISDTVQHAEEHERCQNCRSKHKYR